jgi:hypothetical protein
MRSTTARGAGWIRPRRVGGVSRISRDHAGGEIHGSDGVTSAIRAARSGA